MIGCFHGPASPFEPVFSFKKPFAVMEEYLVSSPHVAWILVFSCVRMGGQREEHLRVSLDKARRALVLPPASGKGPS